MKYIPILFLLFGCSALATPMDDCRWWVSEHVHIHTECTAFVHSDDSRITHDYESACEPVDDLITFHDGETALVWARDEQFIGRPKYKTIYIECKE